MSWEYLFGKIEVTPCLTEEQEKNWTIDGCLYIIVRTWRNKQCLYVSISTPLHNTNHISKQEMKSYHWADIYSFPCLYQYSHSLWYMWILMYLFGVLNLYNCISTIRYWSWKEIQPRCKQWKHFQKEEKWCLRLNHKVWQEIHFMMSRKFNIYTRA